MALYLLAVYGAQDDASPAPEDMEAMFRDVDAFNQDIQQSGHWVFAGGLHPPSTATVVRVRDGETIVTDGPFAETKEQLGGFYLVKCDNLDEAIQIAAKIPGAAHGTIEVRPVMEFE